MTQRNSTPHATRATARVALVTCAELADLDPDDRLLVAPLAELGVAAEPAVWDDPTVDWDSYDLAVLRSTWDYAPRRDEFVAWAGGVTRLANRAEVVAWNTDKHYLAELDAVVPVVQTTWLRPGEGWPPPAEGEVVVKPAVSAGGVDTGRYDLADTGHRRLAQEHVQRLHDAGRLVMIQPYLSAVDRHGETALLYTAGRFSHAIRKGAILAGPDAGTTGLYRPETIAAREPSESELAVADSVLASLPFPAADLLYARVDLIPGSDGAPVLLEVELAEPSLFVGSADGAPLRFATAIAAACRTGGSGRRS
jgi:glutathione synthase/RimK-type ligase-like ATP-grasp enzyme